MANSRVEIREVRAIFEPELTQVYVWVAELGGHTLGVPGWHHKTFPASKSLKDIVGDFHKDDPVMWPQDAPK